MFITATLKLGMHMENAVFPFHFHWWSSCSGFAADGKFQWQLNSSLAQLFGHRSLCQAAAANLVFQRSTNASTVNYNVAYV